MNTREDILSRLIEGSIEESELPALREEIARDPEFAAEIADLTRIDRLLRFQAYLDNEKPDLVVGVLKRLEFAEQDPTAFNHTLQRKINQQQTPGRFGKIIRFVVTPLAIAASLAVVAGGVWWLSQRPDASLELRVAEVRGQVSGFRVQGSGGPESGVTESPSHQVAKAGGGANNQQPTANSQHPNGESGATLDTRHATLHVGDILRPGDGVSVGADGYAKLVYPDRTQVELQQNSRLRVTLGVGENKDAKRLALDGGTFVCSVAPQRKAFEIQTRHAVNRVVGTRFSLGVTEADSRLGVQEGKVELRQGDKILLVSAGEAAVATDEKLEMTREEARAKTPVHGGRVWAWGNNYFGQLGDGTKTNRAYPTPVAGLDGVIAVSGGIEYTVALKADGTVVAWGRNDMGQLGDGTTTDRLNPVAVPGLYGIVAIAAGGYHTLALKADGGVWAWGHNGDGTTNNRATPVPGLSDVMAIAAGQAHTVALKRDQTVWAWGNNSFGQLGDGTRRHYRFLPVQVTMADGSPLRGVMGITAGYKHTVALKSDGSVWAWGGGIGEEERGRASARLTPLPVKLADGSPLSGIIAVAAGSLYTQALKADGTVWGWRDNQRGELGSGVWTSREIFPVQAKLPDGSPLSGITAIATGKRHTVARKDDGTVWACGKNAYGQLGAGKISFPADSLVQVRLRDGAPLSGVVALAAGGNHTVAIVVEAEESVGVSE